MFQVYLSYTIRCGKREVPFTRDRWLSSGSTEEEAIRQAMSDAELVAHTSYGRGVQVEYTAVETDKLLPCPTCDGKGRLPHFSGFYRCPTCQGAKYRVVEHGTQASI